MTIIAVLIFFSFLWWGIVSYAKDLEMNKKIPKERYCVFFKSEEERKKYCEEIKEFFEKLGQNYLIHSKYNIETPTIVYYFKLLSDGICGETFDKVLFYKCSLDDCPNKEIKASIETIYGDKITKIED